MQCLRMKRLGLLPLVMAFLSGPALAALTTEDCSTVRKAHEELLASSFEVERTFQLSVNGHLKIREVALLTFSGGTLETEVIEYEQSSKMWVHDNEGKDFVLEITFACERLETGGDGSYELESEDGLEMATFQMRNETGDLRPVAWRTDETARFLFKKLSIEGRVEYTNFESK